MLISLLVTLIILSVVFAIVVWIVGLLPNPPITPTFKNLILALIGIVAVIYLLGIAFGYAGDHYIHIR